MRGGVRWGALAAAVAAGGAVYVTQAGPDSPHDACVEKVGEHREVAITGPSSDEQIEAFCRQLLRAKD